MERLENQGYPIEIMLTTLVMFSMKADQSMLDGEEFAMATAKLKIVILHTAKGIRTLGEYHYYMT